MIGLIYYIVILLIILVTFGYIVYDDYRDGSDLYLGDILIGIIAIIIYPISILCYFLTIFTEWINCEYGDSVVLKGKSNEN